MSWQGDKPLHKNGSYVRLWGSVTASNLGDGIVLAAAPLAAAAITRDPLLVSGVVVAQRLPWLLFALLAGVGVDRYDRRRMLVAANLLRCAAITSFAVGVVAGISGIWALYLVMFCLGAAETVADNASLAIVPQLVNRRSLERANGRIFAAMPVANELVGPPLGGMSFALAAAAPFALAAGGYAAAAALAAWLAGVYVAARPVQPMSVGREVVEGVRWFTRHRVVRAAAVWAGGYNLFGGATAGVFVLYAQERLGVTGPQFGLLLSCGAVGGIAGGWLADRVVARVGPGAGLLLSNLTTALAYAVFAITTNPFAAGAMFAAMSMATMVANVIAYTLRQTAVPDRLLGRVTAAYRVVGLGSLPVGGLLGGLVARTHGLTATFWLAAAGLFALGLGIARVLTNDQIRDAQHMG